MKKTTTHDMLVANPICISTIGNATDDRPNKPQLVLVKGLVMQVGHTHMVVSQYGHVGWVEGVS